MILFLKFRHADIKSLILYFLTMHDVYCIEQHKASFMSFIHSWGAIFTPLSLTIISRLQFYFGIENLRRCKWSLVIPLLEYCCQLWNSWKANDIQAIKGVQRTFTHKITKLQHLNYWERLHELKLCSLQTRRERYIIIYIWKVPNIDGTMGHQIKTKKHPRHGTQCVIQYPTNRNPARSLQENAVTVFGPCLYNSLPKYLRDIESV